MNPTLCDAPPPWLARLACAAAVVLALVPSHAEPSTPGDPVPGQLVERVVCAADPAQSYAVYLPPSYDPARAWPILYCFDPRGNGARPVKIVQAAAERLGYIVVGSNNSRNGSWEAIDLAARHLLLDTGRRFRIDPRRRYSMGFSGGSRAASAAAMQFDFAGVIGCGAGLPDNGQQPKLRFAYFGAVGDGDFNYSEMEDVMSALADRKVPHRLAVFRGGHEWLPPAVADEALLWFELQAMRSGARPKDDAFIGTQLRDRLQRVAGLPDQGEAYLELQQIVADFDGLADTTEPVRKVRELKGTKPVRTFLSARKRLRRQENEWLDRLYAGVGYAVHPPQRDVAAEMFTHLPAMGPSMSANEDGFRTEMPGPGISSGYAAPPSSDRLAAVRKLATELGRVQADNAAARRVLSHSSAMLERAYWSMDRNELGPAAIYAETAAILRPDAPEPYFMWARVCALQHEKDRARELLATARAKGFRDAARLAELERQLAP